FGVHLGGVFEEGDQLADLLARQRQVWHQGGLAAAPVDALGRCRVFFEIRSEEHTSELQSRENLVCRLLLEKKEKKNKVGYCLFTMKLSGTRHGQKPISNMNFWIMQ